MMALVRCANHKPNGDKKNYVADVNPIGYPRTAAICGRKECPKPGKAQRHNDFRNGQQRCENRCRAVRRVIAETSSWKNNGKNMILLQHIESGLKRLENEQEKVNRQEVRNAILIEQIVATLPPASGTADHG
jgi:hypothetical protein